MKHFINSTIICLLSLVTSSLASGALPPLLGTDAPQLRVESRIVVPKGATGLIFTKGTVSADTAFTSVCAQTENMCVLDTMELAKGRERFFETNAILNLQKVALMCDSGTGIVATVSTLRNQLQLRCKLTSENPTGENLQAVLSQFMTVQFPAKIE